MLFLRLKAPRWSIVQCDLYLLLQKRRRIKAWWLMWENGIEICSFDCENAQQTNLSVSFLTLKHKRGLGCHQANFHTPGRELTEVALHDRFTFSFQLISPFSPSLITIRNPRKVNYKAKTVSFLFKISCVLPITGLWWESITENKIFKAILHTSGLFYWALSALTKGFTVPLYCTLRSGSYKKSKSHINIYTGKVTRIQSQRKFRLK